MTSELKQRLIGLTTQLSETLMTAAILVDEFRTILKSEPDDPASVRPSRSPVARLPDAPRQRPLVDNPTLSVLWQGKTCLLRNTILFRLAARLARQPNQYITAGQLLSDVWEGGVKSPDTIRSAVRHLRQRLRQAGMDDLAAAIRGTGGRYGLMLDGTA
ncbi:MAG: helix-turn-helix domain-containing protein [Planctomycetota bacterium]